MRAEAHMPKGRPFLWDRSYLRPQATYPRMRDGFPSLVVGETLRIFGLAASGVYPAADVTTGAVRSYRTFSPLPEGKDEVGRMKDEKGRKSIAFSSFILPPSSFPSGGIFSVALSVGLLRLAVNQHSARFSGFRL